LAAGKRRSGTLGRYGLLVWRALALERRGGVPKHLVKKESGKMCLKKRG